MAIYIDSTELQRLLEVTPATENIMLVGKHGIGKSEIITDFYESKGYKVQTLFLGQMSDPGDIIGLPRYDEKTDRTVFTPPYWFPKEGENIVLFLDELNRARPEILQTVMDLALNRKLAGRKLPEGSRIISAVNDGDEYQLTDLDPALVSRFNVYYFRPSVTEWLAWASKNGIDQRIIDFIGENNSFLDKGDENDTNGIVKTPDRRGWAKASQMLTATADEPYEFVLKAIGGIVGAGTVARFSEYLSKNSVTGKAICLGTADMEAVRKYTTPQLSFLNESIMRYMLTAEWASLDEEKKNEGCTNVTKYAKILNEVSRESLAHFESLIDNDMYDTCARELCTRSPELFDLLDEFLDNYGGN